MDWAPGYCSPAIAGHAPSSAPCDVIHRCSPFDGHQTDEARTATDTRRTQSNRSERTATVDTRVILWASSSTSSSEGRVARGIALPGSLRTGYVEFHITGSAGEDGKTDGREAARRPAPTQQVQALEPTQKTLPVRTGSADKRTHNYVRHGTSTSTTTDSGYYCTAESPGKIADRHHCEAGYHAWLRRA
jgi:hypothetical protein